MQKAHLRNIYIKLKFIVLIVKIHVLNKTLSPRLVKDKYVGTGGMLAHKRTMLWICLKVHSHLSQSAAETPSAQCNCTEIGYFIIICYIVAHYIPVANLINILRSLFMTLESKYGVFSSQVRL